LPSEAEGEASGPAIVWANVGRQPDGGRAPANVGRQPDGVFELANVGHLSPTAVDRILSGPRGREALAGIDSTRLAVARPKKIPDVLSRVPEAKWLALEDVLADLALDRRTLARSASEGA
jgi:hypothetical protein